MGAAARRLEESDQTNTLSEEMIDFADHLAELLAEEFVRALKEEGHESSGVCEVLEREPARDEHSGPDPRLQAVRGS